MKLFDWLKAKVIDDHRALAWFEEEGADDRISRAFKELLAGYRLDPSTILKTTRMLEPGEKPGLVEVRDIGFHSICAHHFLPFFGEVDLAYVPGDRILGLGKLPRLVDAYARRFQIQEDLVREVAHLFIIHIHERAVLGCVPYTAFCLCNHDLYCPPSVLSPVFSLVSLPLDLDLLHQFTQLPCTYPCCRHLLLTRIPSTTH